MNNVVIIEDEVLLSKNLKVILEANDFSVTCFESAEAFIHTGLDYTTRVYVVDANLPGIGGSDVVKLIRFNDKISPIFMMSGDHTSEKVKMGLACGADDFLAKPFEIEHFVTKINNAHQKSLIINERFFDIGMKMIPEASSILRNGVIVKLTLSEYNIVTSLLDSENKEKSRSDLVLASKNPIITLRTIDVHIYSIRKKMSKVGITVKTIRGHGYKLIY